MIRYSAHFICDDDNDDPGKAYLWLWILSVEQIFLLQYPCLRRKKTAYKILNAEKICKTKRSVNRMGRKTKIITEYRQPGGDEDGDNIVRGIG